MEYLVYTGAALTVLGLVGLIWSIFKVNAARYQMKPCAPAFRLFCHGTWAHWVYQPWALAAWSQACFWANLDAYPSIGRSWLRSYPAPAAASIIWSAGNTPACPSAQTTELRLPEAQ